MEAIQLSEGFREELEQYAIDLEIYERRLAKKKTTKMQPPEKPTPSMKFLGRNIFEHINLHLKKIRSAELENTMRFLNQKHCFALLFYLEHFLRHHMDIELMTRAALFIIKSYEVQIKLNTDYLPLVRSISNHMKLHFKDFRD
mmetsp:Transcript_1866/g.2549  ORF Transcript_1866/g.2549 Transcript_1866/m.2549 type:complete len:143 (-) Transcript_1866:128-556(-)